MLDPFARHRILQLLGIGIEYRGHPHPGQKYRHGWIRVDGVDLEAAVKSGVASSEELTGGEMGTTELVTHNNGARTVRKKFGDVSDTMGPDFPPERQADAEELAALLGQHIGAPVPRVLRTADDEIHMDHVDGEVATGIEGRLYQAARTEEEFQSVKERAQLETAKIVGTLEGIRLGLFDVLTGNWDRANTTNWLVTPDRKPVGIDHSFAFNDEADADTAPEPWALGPFALHFVDIQPGANKHWTVRPQGKTQWSDNPLTPADIDWLRERLADVENDFTRAGRHDWWEFASARLEAIAPFATGTQSRFAS